MKALVATTLLCALVPAFAFAQSGLTGSTPNYVTAPANPDQPDYRPPDRPRHSYEFYVDAGGVGGVDDIEDEDDGRHDRPHRGPRHRRHHR